MNNPFPEIYKKTSNGKRLIRLKYETPCLNTKHTAHEWIEFLISEGVLKECGRIDLEEVCIGSDDKTYFAVICREKSFESEHVNPYAWPSDPQWNFYGCPLNCHCFISPWKMGIKARASSFANSLGSLFRWFSSLPWQTQLLIIFLIILFFAPAWVNALLRLMEAIKK